MKEFDFERIGKALETAKDLNLKVQPIAAYFLLGLLQLALRLPALKVEHPESYENGRRIALLLQQRLGEIDPMISESLETGWDESLDMSTEDYEQFSKTGDLPQRNYSQLRFDIQEEIVLNAIALEIACGILSQRLGDTQEGWAAFLSTMAQEQVEKLTPDQIKDWVQRIDCMRDFQGGSAQL